ncbi:outer membrane beta-barrel protein [Phocaeicola plebeius]|uniref:outer membrane beta-barrel protein n=1 Tax=Phocaeicola plebeius TaxID=310297 RepID=UPI0026EA0ECE|nr:outer membrane beta-barrel protein [Phocaeicola plebeius]
MKAKLSITLAASLFFSGSVYADGNITGSVFNRNTSEPLDYATVVLVNPETGVPLLIGTTTDENGSFVISNAPSGKYIIRISMVGSITQEREITVTDSEVNIGKIELAEDSKLLQEVVVTGQKSQMSVKTDRKVFNVSSNITTIGASAEELLAAVPSVNVSTDGDISLRGNANVLVWINGKEMGMNVDNRAQILRQIPGESIESIEVMTNPSSKHSSEGTAGIINIRLKEDHRNGYFGNAEANVDTRGTANVNFNINYNTGKFESFAGIGLKTQHLPGGSTSYRRYDDDCFLKSDGDNKKNENSMFLRLGTNFKPNEKNTVYLNAIGTLGHKWGHTVTNHISNLPEQWIENINRMRESGDTRGANIMMGYKHTFQSDHYIDMNVSYNIWQGPSENLSHENEIWSDGTEETIWRGQYQDVNISNWEAAIDYSNRVLPWLTLEAGYKGNYNHENSPASYSSGMNEQHLEALDELYNRFKYDTDISALYVNFSGSYERLTFSAGLRGELWNISTRSLGYGQTDADVAPFKKNDFALFPSASIGWSFLHDNELKLNYSRRIRRPFGPQLNTFENIADPSEVHLGNPSILPEYSNAVELSYIKTWSEHLLSVSGYLRSNTDMISHISFLAPMASDPNMNTMYYGHANVGNMLNTGVEIISRNTLFSNLTITTTLNMYNSHLKAWDTSYPLHENLYKVHGNSQDRFVWDVRCMASLRLPWDMNFQATGRYNSRSVTAQGTLEADWDVEAGVRKRIGAWDVSLLCKDIFNSKKSHNILYGNEYTQSISKWSGGRTLRLAVTYTFGKTHSHEHNHHNHIDTGGYGEEHHH